MSTQAEDAYPYRIWLTVSFAGHTTKVAHQISHELSGLRGYTSCLIGDDRGAFHYEWRPGRMGRVARQARTIMQSAGSHNPVLAAFETWRADIRLRQPSVQRLALILETVRELPMVLDVFTNDDRTLTTIEFQNKPTSELMSQIRTLLVPVIA